MSDSHSEFRAFKLVTGLETVSLYSVSLHCHAVSLHGSRNYTMWIQNIIVLIYALALTIGFVTHRHIDTCYIELYQQKNLLGDKVKVQYKRSNIRKINAKSIEVTGDPAYCCFKVFR